MAKELLVNVSRDEEVRVALVEDGRLEEIYLERDSAASNVGNIYLGKVTNVEGSIQAAFVDFGYGRNGFLHVQDLHPDHFPDGGRWDRMTERVGKKIGRRDRPPIQDCLRRGDQIIVQIIKEGIGTKGPTLTSYPSIPGRFLVMMPGVEQMGVSKNIEDEEERRRLRKVLDGLKPPKGVGFIIRTAGMGKTKVELERDFKYLTRLHEQIEHHRKNARPPTLLYSEGDLVTRTVRDVWTGDVDRVVCDDPETAVRIKQFFRLLMPRTKVNVQLYQGTVPLFHAAGVEQEIETMFSRHVPLPSGGSLVIDSTEAVVAIDVNSGKSREHSDAEEMAFRTDMEAAEEICRQLRLRDLGGVVICDFIDLRYSRHRDALFDRLTELFKHDKAKSRHLPMNEFGIVAVTRQRMRPDLKKSVFMPCPMSGGTGVIRTPESMALDVMRRVRVAAADARVRKVGVRLYPTVALHVLNAKRQALADLERQSGKTITLRQDEALAADDVIVELLDERDGQVTIEVLQPTAAEQPDSGGRRRRRRRRGSAEEAGKGRGDRGRKAAASSHDDDEGGLIDLPDLLELGELKLDEVEKLVDGLVADQNAARKAVEKDPQKIIMEALRSGALFEDEDNDDDDDDEADSADARTSTATKGRLTEPAAPSAVAPRQESGGRRGRRGRRRGRGAEGAPEAAPMQERSSRTVEPSRTTGSAPARDQPVRQAPTALDGFGDGADEHEPDGVVPRSGGEAVEDGEERDGRRRRRRRRGRRLREGAAPSNVAAPNEQRPAVSRTGDAGRRAVEARAPARDEERTVNGNRAGAETHTAQRDPFADAAGGGRAEHGGGGRRGRRRRKGRGSPAHPVAGAMAGHQGEAPITARLRGSGLSDDQLDSHVNGNRIAAGPVKPGAGVYRESDDDGHEPPDGTFGNAGSMAHEPAGTTSGDTPGEAGGRRRRRRRRGRGSASQQHPSASPPSESPALFAAEQASTSMTEGDNVRADAEMPEQVAEIKSDDLAEPAETQFDRPAELFDETGELMVVAQPAEAALGSKPPRRARAKSAKKTGGSSAKSAKKSSSSAAPAPGSIKRTRAKAAATRRAPRSSKEAAR